MFWFRQDLRLHDNEALVEAIKSSEEVIPLYVFDPRVFVGKTKFEFRKTGRYRAKSMLESARDLRRNIRKTGSELVVRIENPEREILKIADLFKTYWIFCNRERTQEEVVIQDQLERNLWQNRVRPELRDDSKVFDQWARGNTNVPFIDANMHELNLTGFMANRGRQNVASFLVIDLHINWEMGAEYFESLLIDYHPCSNYGQWNYIEGVGSDPPKDRYLIIAAQTKQFDPDLQYIYHWAPPYAIDSFDRIQSHHVSAQP